MLLMLTALLHWTLCLVMAEVGRIHSGSSDGFAPLRKSSRARVRFIPNMRELYRQGGGGKSKTHGQTEGEGGAKGDRGKFGGEMGNSLHQRRLEVGNAPIYIYFPF